MGGGGEESVRAVEIGWQESVTHANFDLFRDNQLSSTRRACNFLTLRMSKVPRNDKKKVS